MTKLIPLLLALTLAPAAFAGARDEINSGTVTCKGQRGSETVTLTVSVSTAGETASFSDVDPANPLTPWNFTADPRDFTAAIEFQSLSFIFGHHDTTVKVLADGDIFGGSTETSTELAPYKGILFLQVGIVDHPPKKKFHVTCVKSN